MARHASLLEGLPFFLGDAAKFITGGPFKAATDIVRTVTKMAQSRDRWRDARLSGAEFVSDSRHLVASSNFHNGLNQLWHENKIART